MNEKEKENTINNPLKVQCDNCEEYVHRGRVWFYFAELDGWVMSNPYLPDYHMERVLCDTCHTKEGHKKESWVEKQIREGLLLLKSKGGE